MALLYDQRLLRDLPTYADTKKVLHTTFNDKNMPGTKREPFE